MTTDSHAVKAKNLIARFQKGLSEVKSNKSGGAGHKYSLYQSKTAIRFKLV
jgi:hypothetical protein